jgi:hypothetical protein
MSLFDPRFRNQALCDLFIPIASCPGTRRPTCEKLSYWQPDWLLPQHRHGAKVHRETVTISAMEVGGKAATAGIVTETGGAICACAMTMIVMSRITVRGAEPASSCAAATRSFVLSAVNGNPPRLAWTLPFACSTGCNLNREQHPDRRPRQLRALRLNSFAWPKRSRNIGLSAAPRPMRTGCIAA